MSGISVVLHFFDEAIDPRVTSWYTRSDSLTIEAWLIDKRWNVTLLISAQGSTASVFQRSTRLSRRRRRRSQLLGLATSFASGVLAAVAATSVDVIFSIFGIR